jgi:hypothetical protein
MGFRAPHFVLDEHCRDTRAVRRALMIVRSAARVIPLNTDGAVLLFRYAMDASKSPLPQSFWLPPAASSNNSPGFTPLPGGNCWRSKASQST